MVHVHIGVLAQHLRLLIHPQLQGADVILRTARSMAGCGVRVGGSWLVRSHSDRQQQRVVQENTGLAACNAQQRSS